MNTRKIRKPTGTEVVSIVLTLVVFAVSASVGVWVIAATLPRLGAVGAAVVAFLAAVGTEAILSALADAAVEAIARRQSRKAAS